MSDGQVAELLGELTRRGIRLEPRGDALAFFPRRKVPSDLRGQLRQHKDALLELIRGEDSETEPPVQPATTLNTVAMFPPYSMVVLDPNVATLDAL